MRSSNDAPQSATARLNMSLAEPLSAFGRSLAPSLPSSLNTTCMCAMPYEMWIYMLSRVNKINHLARLMLEQGGHGGPTCFLEATAAIVGLWCAQCSQTVLTASIVLLVLISQTVLVSKEIAELTWDSFLRSRTNRSSIPCDLTKTPRFALAILENHPFT